MHANDPHWLGRSGHIPGDFTDRGEPEQDREPMCVDCGASPPAEADDDGLCIDCAVRFYTQHPQEFDDTPERYFALSADLTAVRDRVCMERVRDRGLLIEKPLIAVTTGPTEARCEALRETFPAVRVIDYSEASARVDSHIADLAKSLQS